MTTTLITLPDAEALVIDALLGLPEVTGSALGTRVYGVVPKDRVFPLARVARYGGDPLYDGHPYWLDVAALQVDVWADGGMVEAHDLAELLRGVCALRLPGFVSAGGVISSVKVSGLVQSPDQTFEPAKPRYRFTATTTVHP